MSQLEQAKREAKRLYKLAQSPEDSLQIKSLSEAREIIAKINGYYKWHDYEENLKRQDFMKGNLVVSREIKKETTDLNIDYYYQTIPFSIQTYTNRWSDYSHTDNTRYQSHTPVEMGVPMHSHNRDKNTKTFFSKSKTKPVRLLNYPVVLTSGTGAGKSATLHTFAEQYVKNGEGLVYINGMGDMSLYSRLYAVCEKPENNLYYINFDCAWEENMETIKGHSIDLLNPMIAPDTEPYFKILFGEVGTLLHKIALSTKSSGLLLDSTNLKAMLMPENLLNWRANGVWHEATQAIEDYLLDIGLGEINTLSEINKSQLKKHAQNCERAQITIKLLKMLEDKGLLNINPEIVLDDIFYRKKILIININLWRRTPGDMGTFSDLLAANIDYHAKKLDNFIRENMTKDTMDNHFQNIVIEEANLVITDNMNKLFFNHLEKRLGVNMVFAAPNYDSTTMKIVAEHCNTLVFMRVSDSIGAVPDCFKVKLIDNLKHFDNVFCAAESDLLELRDQKEGEGWVFSLARHEMVANEQYSLEKKCYLEKIKLSYKEPEKNANVRLHTNFQFHVINKKLELSEWIDS